jgi:menaquinone-dependent protoporphyrinogen oxidase
MDTHRDAQRLTTLGRREFLMGTAVLCVTALLPSAGCSMDASGSGPQVAMRTTSFGGDDMDRILVGYATRNGSTIGVAEEIGRALATQGHAVDVKPMTEVPSLDDYTAAVLGSAINGARWLPEACSFAENHAATLSRIPTAVFCVHAMNTGPGERKQSKREGYVDDVRELLSPVAEGYFAGTGLDPDETSGFTRWMFTLFGGDVEGDGRDWPAIRAWANGIALRPVRRS